MPSRSINRQLASLPATVKATTCGASNRPNARSRLAVAASLLVARVLTPMMAAYMLKPIVTAHEDPRWMSIYMR